MEERTYDFLLNDLDDELLDLILSLLPERDLLRSTSLCSKRFRRLALAHIQTIRPPFSSPKQLFFINDQGNPNGLLPLMIDSFRSGRSLREVDAWNLLSIDDSFFTETLCKGLSHPERLRTLKLRLWGRQSNRCVSNDKVHDEAFREALVKLTGLTRLKMEHFPSLTPDVFKGIPSLSNLTSLKIIRCTTLTNESIRDLLGRCAANLKALCLRQNGRHLTPACLEPIQHSPTLLHLVGDGMPLMSPEKLPPHLRTLRWYGPLSSPLPLHTLPSTLQKLALPCIIDDKSDSDWLNNAPLREMTLWTRLIDLVEFYPNLPITLTTLNLQSADATEDFCHLSRLVSLTSLSCVWSESTGTWVKDLPRSLLKLRLDRYEDGELTSATTDHLVHLSRLESLDTFFFGADAPDGGWLKHLPRRLRKLVTHTGTYSDTDVLGLPPLKVCNLAFQTPIGYQNSSLFCEGVCNFQPCSDSHWIPKSSGHHREPRT